MIVTPDERQEFRHEVNSTEDLDVLHTLRDELTNHRTALYFLADEVQGATLRLDNPFSGVFGDALAGSGATVDEAERELRTAVDEYEDLLDLVENRIFELE